MRFYVGNSTSANLQMTNTSIELRRETTISSVKTNTIDTNGDNDLIFRRNGTDVLNIFTYNSYERSEYNSRCSIRLWYFFIVVVC